MKTFLTTIVSPNGKTFDEQVEFLGVPAFDGSLGILARHAPLIALLKKGILTVKVKGKEILYAINNGIVEVDGESHALVLVDDALPANNRAHANDLLTKL